MSSAPRRRAAEHRPPVPPDLLLRQLQNLGIGIGDLLVVHSAFSRTGPVEGGPEGLIDALRRAIGPRGTLMMPSMSSEDDRPFDPATTPCPDMGIVADTFRRLPGVLRSDSPHAFAAMGPLVEHLLRPHPVDPPHGPDSPPGRAHQLGGRVLLLGIGHEANTTVHLAEWLAGVRYRVPAYATVFDKGRPRRIDYLEIDHCCERFAQVDDWLDSENLQLRGRVGYGEARLANSADIVRSVVRHLRDDDTTFLHPPGACDACDAAWRSFPAHD